MRIYIKKHGLFTTCLLFILPVVSMAQESIGMSSGNYAGVTSVWYNPANIADSRYKVDINIIGVNSYFNNNYLLVKNGALVRRLFYKVPYNSSFSAVKNDLLQEQLPVNGKVYGRTESNIHFPLSFMLTTGKRSAIAITMNNRTINKIDSMPVDLARSFFGELRDPSLYGKDMRADSMQYNFLNWQEVGFTYSRVIFNSDHHFLKMGVTLKWLGANAGAYIQTDNAVVSFRDSTTMSLQSPLIHYARTANADKGQFARKDLFNNLQDQAFGWDAGLVYEFRAKVKKFQYVDENAEERTRRDMNKYMFRIGLSIVDMGKFTLKKKELTNDHSANIVNWDFSDVKASNFSEWDTAYSKQVNYVPGASKTFTYRLPAALIANFDLHLFGGFYINVAGKAPFESFKKATDTYISANKWVAVTPRFEGKFFGLYVPIIRANHRTNIGATVKFGPVYLGSNNLAQLLTNENSYEADFHAGVRLSIPYGKPTKLSKYAQAMLYGTGDTKSASQKQLDSLQHEVDLLKRSLYDTSRTKGVQIYINNNGVTSTVDRSNNDSVVIRNNINDQQRTAQDNYRKQQEVTTDTLVRQLAEKNLEVERLKKAQEAEKSGKKKSKKEKGNETIKVETNNEEMVKEMERIRKQMQIQNAALIGGGTAAVIAASNKKDDKKESKGKDSTVVAVKDSTIRIDSSVVTPVHKTDTVYIRDTVKVFESDQSTAFKVVESQKFTPILFANGSKTISPVDRKRLEDLAAATKQHDNWRLEITGMTDVSGSVATNRKMAAARTSEVSNILLKAGVKDNQLIVRSKIAGTHTIPDSENPRRVAIRVLSN